MSVSTESSEFQQPERSDHPTVATHEADPDRSRPSLRLVPGIIDSDRQIHVEDVSFSEKGWYTGVTHGNFTDLEKIAVAPPHDPDEDSLTGPSRGASSYILPSGAYSMNRSTDRTISRAVIERLMAADGMPPRGQSLYF